MNVEGFRDLLAEQGQALIDDVAELGGESVVRARQYVDGMTLLGIEVAGGILSLDRAEAQLARYRAALREDAAIAANEAKLRTADRLHDFGVAALKTAFSLLAA